MNRFPLLIVSVASLFVAGLREQFCTANVSTSTAQGTHGGPMTYRVDAALTKTNLLVKAGTDERHVDICGAADFPVGLAIGEAENIEDTIGVEPLVSGVTKLARCATALTAGIPLYTAANGLVQAEPSVAGTYYKVGHSKRLAVQEGSSDYQIEFEAHFPVKVKVVATPSTVADVAAALNTPALVKFL